MRQDQIALLDAMRLDGQAEAAGLIDHLFARVEGLEAAMRRQQTPIDGLVEHGRVRDEMRAGRVGPIKLAFAPLAPSEPRD